METVSVPLGDRSYHIYIDEGVLDMIPSLLEDLEWGGTAVIITDQTVNTLYGRKLAADLSRAGISVDTFEVTDGEQSKSLRWVENIYDSLISARADRTTMILAVGGGVVGDLAGFAAATFMRGVPYVQIPTTLLAQVDSSVGGKTAVNHPKGKNIIGAFYQPRAVYIDTSALRSLPRREFRAGMSEVVKYGAIKDENLFSYIDDNLQSVLENEPKTMAHLIKRCCAIKAEVVAQDEREGGIRIILNFGHSIGHALEALTGYGDLKHGECVSIGMACAARFSQDLELCPRRDVEALISQLNSLGLPTKLPPLDFKELLAAMARDKKFVRGTNRLVLLERLGKVIVKEGVDQDFLLNSLSNYN